MVIHDEYHGAFFYSPVPAKREYQKVLCYHYSDLIPYTTVLRSSCHGERGTKEEVRGRVMLFKLGGPLGSKQHLGSPSRDGIQLSLQVGNLALQDFDIFLRLG